MNEHSMGNAGHRRAHNLVFAGRAQHDMTKKLGCGHKSLGGLVARIQQNALEVVASHRHNRNSLKYILKKKDKQAGNL